MLDGAFTARFDQAGYLMLGFGWLAAFTAATAVVFHTKTSAATRPGRASKMVGAERSPSV
jgi:hypothetical protein